MGSENPMIQKKSHRHGAGFFWQREAAAGSWRKSPNEFERVCRPQMGTALAGVDLYRIGFPCGDILDRRGRLPFAG
jgi:hypothetical protein